jgi:cobalt transporter subunit CbtB
MSAIATTSEANAVSSFGVAERLPALLVMILGLAVIYAVGFSPFARAHNAAHDTRHATGFPCH